VTPRPDDAVNNGVRSESAIARQAFEDFIAMGPDRSVEALYRRYAAQASEGIAVPSKSHQRLVTWSQQYRWPKRAKEHDREQGARRRRELTARVDKQLDRMVVLGEELQELGIMVAKARAAANQVTAAEAVAFIALGAKLTLRGMGVPEQLGAGQDKRGDDFPPAESPREQLVRSMQRYLPVASLPAPGEEEAVDVTAVEVQSNNSQARV
jgi:hypothetical protein